MKTLLRLMIVCTVGVSTHSAQAISLRIETSQIVNRTVSEFFAQNDVAIKELRSAYTPDGRVDKLKITKSDFSERVRKLEDSLHYYREVVLMEQFNGLITRLMGDRSEQQEAIESFQKAIDSDARWKSISLDPVFNCVRANAGFHKDSEENMKICNEFGKEETCSAKVEITGNETAPSCSIVGPLNWTEFTNFYSNLSLANAKKATEARARERQYYRELSEQYRKKSME